MTPVEACAVLIASLLLGTVPFCNLVAQWGAGVDLRAYGSGTVSGSSLYTVAGLKALLVGGLLDVGKGAGVGLLAGGSSQPKLTALAAALAISGHNWSPFCKGAGGRGLAPSLGLMAVVVWPGAVILLAGLALGRLAGATGLGCFVAYMALCPVLALTYGGNGALIGAAIVAPMLLKRVMGNHPPTAPLPRSIVSRILLDRDPVTASDMPPTHG